MHIIRDTGPSPVGTDGKAKMKKAHWYTAGLPKRLSKFAAFSTRSHPSLQNPLSWANKNGPLFELRTTIFFLTTTVCEQFVGCTSSCIRTRYSVIQPHLPLPRKRHLPSGFEKTVQSRVRIPVEAWMFMHVYLCFVMVTSSLGIGAFRSSIDSFNKAFTDLNSNNNALVKFMELWRRVFSGGKHQFYRDRELVYEET